MQRGFAPAGPQTGFCALFDDNLIIPGKDENRVAEVHKKRKGARVFPIVIFLLIALLAVSCAAYMIHEEGLMPFPANPDTEENQSTEAPDSTLPTDGEVTLPPEDPGPGEEESAVLPPDKDKEEEPPGGEGAGDEVIQLPEPNKEENPPVTSGEANAKAEYAYFDDAVFIGDSLTQGLDIYGKLPNASYIASQGINPQTIHGSIVLTDGRTVTVLEELARVPHRKIYIMLGSNGIAWMSKQTIVDYYTQLLESIKAAAPDSLIYVQSILPVTASKSQDERYSNAKICDYNKALEKMAKDQNVYYLDVSQALKNEEGVLPQEASPSDGMHMTAPYYQKWVDYLLAHTVEDPANPKETEEDKPEEKESETEPASSPEEEEAKAADKKLTLAKGEKKEAEDGDKAE